MPRHVIPASVIAQRGKQITLIDGTTATVVYTFSSLMTLEETFGSIAGALEAVQDAERGKAFTSIADILAAGLEHETTADGAQLSSTEVLRSLLDPMLFTDYSDALGEALSAAFPQDVTEGGDDDADPTKDSRGESGITSPSSPSDAVTPSSGA